MRRGLKAALATAGTLGFLVLAFLWFDAEAEVRVLCGFIRPGMTEARAVEALETGNYLRYAARGEDGPGLRVWSRWNVGSSRCTVETAEGVVTGSAYRSLFPLEKVAGGVATAGLLGLLGFHLLLAGGAPWGERAWGGRHRILPPALRAASLASAAVVAVGAALVLARSGLAAIPGLPQGVLDAGVGALVLLFLGSALANRLGAHGKERRLGVPLSLLLAGSCLLVLMAH